MALTDLAKRNPRSATATAVETAEPVGAMPMRSPSLRINDYYEVYASPDPQRVQEEAARCMNCGAAFCMPEGGYRANDGSAAGCPISNRIPEWNRFAEAGRWRDAYERLALTNNFPEFTARVCPAPCQDSCIVGIHDRPVGIKSIERAIIDRAFESGWVRPRTPQRRTGRRIAIVGSGPAGLAAADELNAAGHHVTVLERSDTPGGLLIYGIPTMKLNKAVVARRIALMEQSGISFETSCDVGHDIAAADLAAKHDATLVAVGALTGRDLYLPGRNLNGIIMAMPYLEAATRRNLHRTPLPEGLDAAGRDVVIIGGGDTGADCIATAIRQGAASVTNITRRVRPPSCRSDASPWPGPPATYTLDYAHAEGLAQHGEDPRRFGVSPIAFVSDGEDSNVSAMQIKNITPVATHTELLPAQLVILAIGFTGHDAPKLFEQLGLSSEGHSLANCNRGVFLAGDACRGPSLVVEAIADGRRAARQIDHHLASRPRRD